MAEVQKTQSPAEVAEAQKVMEGMKVLNTVKNNPFWVTGNIDPLRVENLKSLASKNNDHTPGNINFDTVLTDYDNLPDESKTSATMSDQDFQSLKAGSEAAVGISSPSEESGQSTEKKEIPKELDYTIEYGNTLSSLARKFDTTIDSIMKLNPQITDPNTIIAGDHLKIHVGDKSAHADSINKPSQGSNTTAPDIQQTHTPANKPMTNTQGTETAAHEKPDTKPDAETVDHKPTSGSVAKDYQSALHGKPAGQFGKLRWTHEHMIPEMKGPGQMLSEAKTQIEDMAKVRLEDFWVEIRDNTIRIPGNKEPIVLQTVEKYANIRNGNGSIDLQLYGENDQKHILTAGTDGVLLLDMKPLPRVGKNNPIQTSAVESNTPKHMEEDNNSKTETVASVPGIGGWDGPST